MEARQSRPASRMPVAAGILILLALLAGSVLAPPAKAAHYKMVTCAGLTGAAPYWVQTNTASPQNPGGIFEFHNGCAGAGGDPPGDAAFMRIVENQPSGPAGAGAFGIMNWDSPPYIHFLAAGGYTRQAYAFNDGWRARFWAVHGNGGATQLMTQGAGLPNSGGQWATTGIFGPHLWPFGYYGEFHRFAFELACVRPAGCDRANYNATDANGFVFILSDNVPSSTSFYNTGSPLLQGAWVRGVQEIGWNITEHGSGLRLERVRLDGQEIDRVDFQAAGACSTSFSQTNGEAARGYTPCPVGGPWPRAINYNTAAVADGAHTLTACSQDYSQYQGLNGTGSESCDGRTIHTDNTAPGAPSGLFVNSANPQRYLDRFNALFSLPPNQGSPIRAVHYEVINSANEVVQPRQTLSATNPTQVANIQGPTQPGDYRLRVWLEDTVGFQGPASTTPIPRDTTPPAAPQSVSVTAPDKNRIADGFDLRWRNIVDAGSPVSAVHYEVLGADGRSVVPRQTVPGQNVETVSNLETPTESGKYTLRMWLSDAEGNHGAAAAVPLSYECVRSDSKAGEALNSGMGAQQSETEVVHEGTGSIVHGALRAADGRGVGPVPVCIFSRVVTDQQREFLGLAITAADGTYKFPVPPGASRELIAVHRRDHRELVSRSSIQTIVHPTLKARKKVVYNKHAVRFFGEIPGPHNDRVVIILQAKVGKGWSAFRRYRTRGDGKFSASYRFRRTFQKRKYVMRAQVRQTVGYPYLQGNSKRLQLLVLPKKSKKPKKP
jgi:hypothetical protein